MLPIICMIYYKKLNIILQYDTSDIVKIHHDKKFDSNEWTVRYIVRLLHSKSAKYTTDK